MKKKMVFIKVTTESVYAFEEGEINGWDTDYVIKDWFENYPIDSPHATRDAYQVGYSSIVTKAKVMNEEQEEKQRAKIDRFFKRLDKRKKKLKKQQDDFMNKWTDGSWKELENV